MKPNQPFSFRISEEATKSIDAESRITGKSMSDVARVRIEQHIAELESGDRYAALILRDLRRAMVRAVEMSDRDLDLKIKDMQSFLPLIQNEQSRKESDLELSVFITEKNLRYGHIERCERLAQTCP